ncbi:hypothetical protein ANCCAN_13428 [Ancylostoma caninum]|uniref:GDSL-like protein n=1 Tax=Ancylostoma caninum TaxID=29170 RepID=A0A368G8A2_ANCCA|nr:hypothetical protein ANCCAN_13428 [Ancylostoma caninum]
MGARLDCQWEVMQPSRITPADVNHVRLADIKMIAAMGDSYVIGTLSRNNDDEIVNVFPGNSFVTGADEPLRKHITLANIMKQFNPSLVGASYGSGYHNTNFNVAVCRNQSADLVWQAEELIHRIKSRETNLLGKWKLIFMFVGTYDLGRLNCHDPVAYEIQNDRIFESYDFAVAVQGFMDKVADVFRTDAGGYDEKMYASNHLHLSKYGNAMLAKLLWNSLLEPVGQKAKRLTSKSIRAMRLKCPTKGKCAYPITVSRRLKCHNWGCAEFCVYRFTL